MARQDPTAYATQSFAGSLTYSCTTSVRRAIHWDPNLAQAARFHSYEMAELNFFDHDTHADNANLFDGSTSFANRVGKYDEFAQWGGKSENIAAGYGNPALCTKGWLESTGHCNNIYSASWDYLGLGTFLSSPPKHSHVLTTHILSLSHTHNQATTTNQAQLTDITTHKTLSPSPLQMRKNIRSRWVLMTMQMVVLQVLERDIS